ncbi:hypothetical protein Cgig2_021269 [Carnegiea gigantea]|uniref:Uncharacterized protein n=1 Tax=Carnegiea gigantea TaxID=171969 RepID=A0A9Q1JXL3_9CARY|nr:hypothetical protein Cgig2_021269 [Carnegiea gigantea]
MERLKVVEIDLEKDQTRTKQALVNANWMKTMKKKLIKAFGSCVIDDNQPFTVVDAIYTKPLLDTIGEVGTHNNGFGGNLSPPSSCDGRGDGGNGGANDIGNSQSSRPCSRDVNPTIFDYNDRRGAKYEGEKIVHTYYRLRKAKDKATTGPPNYEN